MTFDLLNSNKINSSLVSNCTYVVNLVKFTQAVCNTSCSQRLVQDYAQMDSLKTECLWWLITGECIKISGAVPQAPHCRGYGTPTPILKPVKSPPVKSWKNYDA